MDFSVKKCCTDRLSSLPVELICQILSLLPTKDAAIVSLSSKKMRSVFMYLTSLDFDDSPISYCGKNPQIIQRFQIFKKFVSNVLQKSQSPYLSKFRLGFGGDLKIWSRHFDPWLRAFDKNHFPNLKATTLNAWISFPLSRCGVREIDLRILVGNPRKLPCALFTCETLEVLKIDTNLNFELVSSMSSFKLPILKVLQLYSMIIPEDDFVSRLVSNCPSLQELCIDCPWKYGKSVVISSPSLQKLGQISSSQLCHKHEGSCPSFNQYLSLLECWGTSEECFQEMLNLVQALCNVQHLSLMSSFLEKLDHEDLKNQLPTFHNLKHLEIDNSFSSNWDDTDLFEFLRHSPVLEVLEFPMGIDPWTVLLPDSPKMSDCEYHRMIAESERFVSTKNQVSRYCCKPHLKRIIIKKYCGTMREVKLVRCLLEIAPALEELLIICKYDVTVTKHYINPALAESTLKTLPMASSTCSIIVQ